MKANHVMEPFRFKKFSVAQDRCKMKVGTDGVLLGAWSQVEGHQKGLDIGTGTGVIALILGQRSEQLTIAGVEIDQDSCQQAAENFAAAPWNNRLSIIDSSVQEYAANSPEKYDLIVSNPPFFTGGTISDSQDRNDVRHTIKLSHADLLRSVQKLLTPEGRFNIVLPLIEGLRFIELAETYNLRLSRRQGVRPKASKPVSRLLLEFQKGGEGLLEEEDLVIQEEEGRNNWTEQYEALTRDFYLNM